MMRPLYETADNVAEERAAISWVCDAWRVQAVKLPVAYQLDFMLVRDRELRAWSEVKCRTNTHDAYSSYLLSLHKMLAARALQRETDRPFVLIVNFTDGVFFWKDRGLPLHVEPGGRIDRGDWQDREPVVLIPIEEFQALSH